MSGVEWVVESKLLFEEPMMMGVVWGKTGNSGESRLCLWRVKDGSKHIVFFFLFLFWLLIS